MEYTEDNFKELLLVYVNAEMDSIIPEQMDGYDHVYSRRYMKKLRKMMWSEKYFGSNLMIGYMVRRVAFFAILLLSLYAATEVSAKVFGINPWKVIVSFFAENEVNHKIYKELDTAQVAIARTVVRDIPSYVPEGYEVESVQNDRRMRIVWYDKEFGTDITYSRSIIAPDKVVVEDASYDLVTEISVAGYRGYCYADDEFMWIQWEDISFRHQIEVIDEIHIEELINMANSLYE